MKNLRNTFRKAKPMELKTIKCGLCEKQVCRICPEKEAKQKGQWLDGTKAPKTSSVPEDTKEEYQEGINRGITDGQGT